MSTHICHYNVHADQRYFLGAEHRNLYNLIAMNGNIVSHTPAGVAAFIATANKDFYIDPQTHAFQHSTGNLKRDESDKDRGEPPRYKFKPSIEKLANLLGKPFADVIREDRPITPWALLREDGEARHRVVDDVCQSVVEFQQKTLIESLDEESREFIGDEVNFQPALVVAPYFYLSSHRFTEWQKVNIECYRATKRLVTGVPVFFELVVSQEVLHFAVNELLETVSEANPDGVLLWIDEQMEEDLSVREISNYVGLVKQLKEQVETVYNTHGGYLSTLLCHPQIGGLLDGVGHSVNYGEARSVIPVGGGIPMARFYFPSIHSRLRFGDALGIIRSRNWLSATDSYRDNVCKCAYCSKLIKERDSLDEFFLTFGESHVVKSRRRSGTIVSLEYPTREAKRAAASHYLYCKAKEFDDVRDRTFRALVDELKTTFDDLESYGGEDLVGHLYNWYRALEDLMP